MLVLQTKLAETLSPASVNLMITAVRGVLKACWRLGLIDHEMLARTTDITPLKHNSVKPATGRMLSQTELNRLIATCLDDPDAKVGLRDAAIIACAYALGLRRAEVIGLNLADIASHDATTIALTVRGKGNKQRVGYLRGAFADFLNEYLVSRGTTAGPLFQRSRAGGRKSVGGRVMPPVK